MNELNIKKICAGDIRAKDIPSILDKENIVYNRIDNVNWKEYQRTGMGRCLRGILLRACR